MSSVVSAGTTDRIAARTLFNVLRAGSGTAARYSSTVSAAAVVFAAAGRARDEFFSIFKSCQEEHAFSRTLPDLVSAALPSLLLVVHCSALVLLALRIGSIDCHRAALTVGRDHDVGRENNLTAFFGRYVNRVVVNLFS